MILGDFDIGQWHSRQVHVRRNSVQDWSVVHFAGSNWGTIALNHSITAIGLFKNGTRDGLANFAVINVKRESLLNVFDCKATNVFTHEARRRFLVRTLRMLLPCALDQGTSTIS